jgi:tetratricopeptide (TPR) repeat protein
MVAYIRTSLKLVAVLTSVLFFACDWSSPGEKKATHLERAAKFFEKGQYQEAIVEYRNVVQIDPKDAKAHYQLALSYLKIGGVTHLQSAFTELNRSIDLDKSNDDAQLKLGELYLLGNEPKKAREQADIVLVSTPENTEGLVLRGRSLVSEQRYRDAIAEFKKAIERDPQNMQTYIELAQAQVFVRETAAAEETLTRALAIEPHSIKVLIALGDFRVTTGKPDQAELIYKQVLENSPDNEEAYLKLASLYQRYGKWSEVESVLRKLAALKPHDEKPLIHLGDFYTWRGQHDKAFTSYQQAIEVNPSSSIARDKLIWHYLETGKTSEAEPKVKEILAKNDKDVMGRFFTARIYLAKGSLDDAISLLQGVIKDEPQFAPAHHFLGVGLLQKRQLTQARGAFSEAIRLNPNSSESHTALAQIHLSEGSLDLAIEDAQAALRLNPHNVKAAIISGDAYLRKGDVAKSKQVFEAIAKSLPNESVGPYRLGLVSRAEKNDTKALAYFEEAIGKKPSAIEPLAQVVIIKIAQGRVEEARERVTKQIQVVPNNPHFYNLLGQIWVKAKDRKQAEVAFKKAIELDNSLLSAYTNLAQNYYEAGETDQAVKEYEMVLAREPNLVQAHMMLGIIHEGRQEHDKAKIQYEAVLKLNPRFAPAANNLAWLIVEHGGNLDLALSYGQTAREEKPDDPNVADTLGWVYYKKNAFLLAISLLKEAVEKLPNEPVIRFHLGMAQTKSGDTAAAKKSLQAALKISDSFRGSEEAKKTLAGL